MTIRKVTIPLLIGLFVVLGVGAGKRKIRPTPTVEQPLSCRLVLAPLPVDKPIDQEIARQQALILNASSPATALERLGWTFVKKARLSFDAGFYKLAEQCAACLEAQGSRGPDTL